MIKKKIVINNKKDLNNFYNKLFIYRSFLYRFTYFYIEKDKYNIKSIINGLNIKKRYDRCVFVIDEACKYIDNYYKDKNICDFKYGKCINHRIKKLDYVNGCCRKCRLQSSKGCTSKNVACKLFYCKELENKYKLLNEKDVKVLYILSYIQRITLLSDFFSSKEEVAMDLYCFPIATSIRIGLRFLKLKR